MRPRLALLFLFALATIYPVPSCRYKTYAQESTSTDENAGIMTLAAGDLAYTRISDLIRGQYDGYTLTSESSETNPAELYTYILKDVADDSTGDVWLFSGMLLAYGKRTSSSSSAAWLEFSLTWTLYRLSNGNWALCSSSVAFGLPNNMTSFNNTYGVTYDEGANYYEQLVAAARRSSELRGTTFNETSYYNYINYATWDTDNGGVNNLAEWVRGTAIDYWQDDAPSDSKCKCGACCSCECKCGQWGGAECGKTSDDCDCHPKEADCTCVNYCCSHTCECEACKDKTEAEHGKHENGYATCNGGIGSLGCACHDTTEEAECECAKYCCKHTCECEKCADGTHSAHKNDNGECDGTYENCSDCHEEENPEEDCTCVNYCCACKCECKKCKTAGSCSGNHENGHQKCDGVASGSTYCCSCHDSDDEEDCTCANYCCKHACTCKKCGDGEHSAHGNGLSTCDGTTENTGCVCHETTGDEEDCTCANYCCYHTCECKRCASLPAEKHSAHKNGSPTCTGATGSGGCSCHTTTDDKVEFPEEQDYEVPEEKQKDSFLPSSDFNDAFGRLRSKIVQKFGLEKLSSLFGGDFSGELPSWSFLLPNELGGTVDVDFNALLDYSIIRITRGVLAFLVYFFTATTVFNSLRRLL